MCNMWSIASKERKMKYLESCWDVEHDWEDTEFVVSVEMIEGLPPKSLVDRRLLQCKICKLLRIAGIDEPPTNRGIVRKFATVLIKLWNKAW